MTGAPRIAIFGLLGSGNLGNHGSFDAMLAYLRTRHPDADLACVCAGPGEVEREYGVPSIPINWYQLHDSGGSRVPRGLLKAFGKLADVVRTLAWVRRYDVVIVPGMGVLETTQRLRPWGFPWALFLVCAWGRLVGTKVALVSVGANVASERSIRWLFTRAARCANYRSYRDEESRSAMAAMGLDVSRDEVYPDLAFALPVPPETVPAGRTVVLGVMAFRGTHAGRQRAESVYSGYLASVQEFARRLVDQGYRLRLVTGDPADEEVVAAIVADLRTTRPELVDTQVVAEPADSFGALLEQLAAADVVVASRFHNVLGALMLAKPTLSISYAQKNDVLMHSMGLDAFCHQIDAVELPRLMEQFRALESAGPELAAALRRRRTEYRELLDRQFEVLSSTLLTSWAAAPAGAGRT